MERDERGAEGSEGHGGGVGEQRQTRGFEGREAEADEDGSADGDRGAEAGGAFKEGSEGEGDEEQLQAAVFGDVDQALLQQAKRPARTVSWYMKMTGKTIQKMGKCSVCERRRRWRGRRGGPACERRRAR